MSFRALLYAYVLGGFTFIPLVLCALVAITIYTSVPVQEPLTDARTARARASTLEKSLSDQSVEGNGSVAATAGGSEDAEPGPLEVNDHPKTRRGWLTVRRTFEESELDGFYVTFVKSYLDARSKDPKRSRPKDMWYVVLKGKILYLYEDESMTECEAAIELGGHEVVVYPEGLADGELFTRRTAICLRPKPKALVGRGMPSVTKQMTMEGGDADRDEEVPMAVLEGGKEGRDGTRKRHSKERDGTSREAAKEEAFNHSLPWFIFVRSCVEMEDWYLALVHASDHPAGTPLLSPLQAVFSPFEMNHLVATLDQQPDVIPMRWLNALLGRIFFSFYKTQMLETCIIHRLMKKLSKVKRPTFLTEVAVTRFSIGDRVPTLSKPMLKELTKEGDASLEIGLSYKGEIRATVEATAVINLGARFKSYTVKLVLAVVLRELEGNLLVKVKRPPSSRMWYAFTKPPRMVLNVEPIVSDRQITWSMILNTIESKIEEIIADSVVLPNMDDISFWDSTPYEHRGGLWSDAARTEKPPTQSVGALAAETPLPDRSSTVCSAPASCSLDSGNPKSSAPRSWFGLGEIIDNDDAKDGQDTGIPRGRRSRAQSAAEGSTTPSSGATAAPVSGALDTEEDAPKYLSPNFSPRSSSAHSQARSSRTHSVSSSVGGDSNPVSDSSAGSASQSPRHSFGTVSTTSSFLLTLKSKAADKQALSNTARETIRKWGSNWATLRRDISRSGTQDEVPDAGPADQRSRSDSAHARPSYAEVRAAVAARREQHGQAEGAHNASSPIPIPQTGSLRTGDSVNSRSVDSSLGKTSDGVSASSKASGMALSRSTGDKNAEPFYDHDFGDDHPGPSPIHTQPSQARTMTIPGIHASHRGEIMSIGNVAPPPHQAENKPKATTIQSMYRLWKSPTLSGQQDGSESQTSARCEGMDRNQDVTPLALSSDSTPPSSKPVPPPLPPRTAFAAKLTPDLIETRDLIGRPPLPTLQSGLASDVDGVLDRELPVSRSSPEHVIEVAEPAQMRSPDSKPPLPPRRFQTPSA
ncbi:hypothetical protein EDD17DRAFT_1476196 [Pisolithus thermaeus]|nr:hypothetical protein EV401DRAFT_1865724 [Pisolithus croceorrhizus]KAI6163796.1 hypothetical protein EDD17DRAFT_1476196 [Pisolithus thermaeus]